ncbi:hypothetical protein MRB53_025894 [Persea americana]|uniref:Uncharacterized protein n=1 Tax=Persea americana TaxID=3435 RepID=A0ACC2LGT8_PERAE|nr:hypothetical protein MRB53_025894 [Persea americana]
MEGKKPHVVCVPCPAQGHIIPMMQLAKLLHSRGFLITFVNTDFSHKHLLRSRGADSLECLDGFRFETIYDGLSSLGEAMEDPVGFTKSIEENSVSSFRDLLTKLHHPSDGSRVTCIIADAIMTYTLKIAEELGIPEVLFCSNSACGQMAYFHYQELIRRGLVPLKDESYISNGYLDTTIDWIPGMRNMRLRDLPSFIRTTDPNEFFLNLHRDRAQIALKASLIIFNTFDDLELEVLHAMRSMFPPRIYTIGPLSLQCRLMTDSRLNSIKSGMWKEEADCLKWLDSHEAASVVYVSFGSTTVSTPQQVTEFAWGIVNSNHPFLWVIRHDLIMGGHSNFPQDLQYKIQERGMLVSWCPQEDVLAHPSVGLFLTHCGWNSTLEGISSGVPMLCWPFWADQQTNCRYTCNEWGVGMEIDNNAKREEIEVLIMEMMGGEKGKEMRKKALKWKESAENATKEGGSSYTNLELLVQELLQPRESEVM